jgi:hypothetical protein
MPRQSVLVEIQINLSQHDNGKVWEAAAVPGIKSLGSSWLPGCGCTLTAEGSKRALKKACKTFGLTDEQMQEVEEQLNEV